MIPNAKPSRFGLNPIRGLVAAFAFGAVGFLAPILMGLAFCIARWRWEGTGEFDRSLDLGSFPTDFALPAVASATLFSAAGWATYAPRGRHPFVPTLVVLFLIWFPSCFLLASVLDFLGLIPQRLKGDYSPLIEPSSLFIVIMPAFLASLAISIIRGKFWAERTSGDPEAIVPEASHVRTIPWRLEE